MIMLSGGKSQKEGGWRGSGEWLLCSRLSHNFLFWNVTVEEELPRRGHVKTQGGWKICIDTEKERFPGGASEGRSNRAEYPMTKVQLRAKVLRWENTGSVENYSYEFLIKTECWISWGPVDGCPTWWTICISKRLLVNTECLTLCLWRYEGFL